MNLNSINGRLTIDEDTFTSDFNLSGIEYLYRNHAVKLIINNPPYKYFQIPDLTYDKSILLGFEGLKIENLSLGANAKLDFPPYEVSQGEEKLIKTWLKELGGERSYSWGKVEFSRDVKGGSISILITYLQLFHS